MLKKLRPTTRIFSIITAISIIGASLVAFVQPFSFADEIDDIQQEIDSQNTQLEAIRQDLADSQARVENYKANQESLYGQRYLTQVDLDETNAQIGENTTNIDNLEAGIEKAQELIDSRILQRDSKVKNLYMDVKLPFLDKIFGSKSINYFSRIWKYKEAGVGADTDVLGSLSSQLDQLNANLEESETLREELLAVNVELESQVSALNTQIAGLSSKISYEQQRQSSMSGELGNIEAAIQDLTAQQEELIRLKLIATQFNTSVGSTEQGVEYLDPPGFSNGYAFFTYGYPHRVGMNQYGAYGRALAGQSAEQILGTYYSNTTLDKNYASGITITVNGCNEDEQCFANEVMNIEDYLLHIYEMPSGWPKEALRAQAVAARTYALDYTANGTRPICPSQSCQVIKKEANAAAWQDAVRDTAGWVVLHDGVPITAWYASTAGGYTRSSQDVWGGYKPWALGISDYDGNGNAYDGPEWGDSPWYHKAWGETARGNPWLTNEETQDLFNAYLLSEHSSAYNQYLSQPDKVGWSAEKVKEELTSLGISPVGNISAIVSADDGTGYIESVIIDSENYGLKSFDGYLFRSMYNLRSLGTLVIWTSRFDVQKS